MSKDKPVIKLATKEGFEKIWELVPYNCVEIQKQFVGDWVGSYSNEVLIVCKDKNGRIIKGIEESKFEYKIVWDGVPFDDKYGYTPTLKKGV